MADGFTIKQLDEFETNGRWSLVRRGLDVASFGLNVVEIEQGYSIPEHNELERDQEEVFIVLDGDAVMVIDGEEHPAPAGHVRPRRAAAPAHRPERQRAAGHAADRLGADDVRLHRHGLGVARENVCGGWDLNPHVPKDNAF